MKKSLLALIAAISQTGLVANDGPEFHEDYYLGFSQGAYYGLMLAGVEYDVAWCMKSELAAEGAALGSGAEFQARLERLLGDCRSRFPPDDAE